MMYVYVENLENNEVARISMPTDLETIEYMINKLTGGTSDYEVADVIIETDEFSSEFTSEMVRKSLEQINEVATYLVELNGYEIIEFTSLYEVYGNASDTIDIHSEGDYTMISDVVDIEDLGIAAVEQDYFGIEIPEALANYIDHAAIGRDMVCSGEWAITKHDTAISTLR